MGIATSILKAGVRKDYLNWLRGSIASSDRSTDLAEPRLCAVLHLQAWNRAIRRVESLHYTRAEAELQYDCLSRCCRLTGADLSLMWEYVRANDHAGRHTESYSRSFRPSRYAEGEIKAAWEVSAINRARDLAARWHRAELVRLDMIGSPHSLRPVSFGSAPVQRYGPPTVMFGYGDSVLRVLTEDARAWDVAYGDLVAHVRRERALRSSAVASEHVEFAFEDRGEIVVYRLESIADANPWLSRDEERLSVANILARRGVALDP